MKKKFLISGAAVFLAVCLLTSALFAFADSNGPFLPVKVLNYSNGIITSYSDFNNVSSGSALTSSGGSVHYYSLPSGSLYVFEAGTTLFYHGRSSMSVRCSDSLLEVGDSFSSLQFLELSGVSSGDSYDNNSIYKFVLPTEHSYYFISSFLEYIPPVTLWGRVTRTIDGIIASFSTFINGCMSNSVLAICVIVIPVFTLIVTILFSVIPHRGKVRSGKRSYRRRR